MYTGNMLPRHFFIRNLDAEQLQDGFLATAILTVVVTRFFLFLTNYPQLGGDSLHIAHMLWGGFFMLIALLISMTFLSRSAGVVSSILGGIGFGLFIDELGKLLTHDNNYFFQPTVALIYVIFILLYLGLRAIPKYKTITQDEYLINAIDMMKEAVINDLDSDEKRQAKEYLSHADKNDPIVKIMKRLYEDINVIQRPEKSIVIFVRKYIRKIYVQFSQSQFIAKTIVGVQFIQSIFTISLLLFVLTKQPTLAFDEVGKLLSSVCASILVFLGLLFLQSSRLKAYHYFKLAVLINIFLTQFFVFYRSEFSALSGLILNIMILIVVNYVIGYEERNTQ